MEAPSPERVMTLRFLRIYPVRIVIGTVLMIYIAISFFATNQRERRIAKAIESHGGNVEFNYVGPDWMPQFVQDRPYFERITLICQLGARSPFGANF